MFYILVLKQFLLATIFKFKVKLIFKVERQVWWQPVPNFIRKTVMWQICDTIFSASLAGDRNLLTAGTKYYLHKPPYDNTLHHISSYSSRRSDRSGASLVSSSGDESGVVSFGRYQISYAKINDQKYLSYFQLHSKQALTLSQPKWCCAQAI